MESLLSAVARVVTLSIPSMESATNVPLDNTMTTHKHFVNHALLFLHAVTLRMELSLFVDAKRDILLTQSIIFAMLVVPQYNITILLNNNASLAQLEQLVVLMQIQLSPFVVALQENQLTQ